MIFVWSSDMSLQQAQNQVDMSCGNVAKSGGLCKETLDNRVQSPKRAGPGWFSGVSGGFSSFRAVLWKNVCRGIL